MVELAPDVDPIIPMPSLPPFGRHDPDDDAVVRPRAIASVLLAKTRGKSSFLLVYIIYIMSVFFSSQQIPLESTQTCTPNKPPDLPNHICRFLFSQHHPDNPFPTRDQDISLSTIFNDKISVFHSATATYYAPSDHSSIFGMHKQCIWSTPIWRQGPPHCNCVFVKKDTGLAGMHGLHVVQVLLILSFTSHHILYPCTLVQWFIIVGDAHVVRQGCG